MHQGLAALVRASADRKAVRSRARRSPIVRSELRLADLKTRDYTTLRLMNVKIPAEVAEAIDVIVGHVHASKTEVVLAPLNEGLQTDIMRKRLAVHS